MSSAETIYTFRTGPGPDFLVRGRAQVASLPAYRDGALAAPTEVGSTFKLFEPGEDLDDGTPLVSGAIDVTGSIAVYPLLAIHLPSTLDFGRGYVEVWHLVMPDGTTRDILRPAALVRSPLHPVITDVDVDPRGELARHRGATITTFQTWIDEAWLLLLGRLEEVNDWPERVWSAYSFREYHLRATRAAIYGSFARSQGGKWLDLKQEEERQADFAWKRIAKLLDSDQNGQPDDLAARGIGHGLVLGNYPGSTRYNFGGLS